MKFCVTWFCRKKYKNVSKYIWFQDEQAARDYQNWLYNAYRIKVSITSVIGLEN